MSTTAQESTTRRGRRPRSDSSSFLPESPAYRVVVADDFAVTRRGVRTIIESLPGVEVCGEATTGLEAVELVRKEKPNLLVIDLSMPEMNGLDAVRLLRQECPETEALILTMHFSDELAREVLRSGAIGYVLKSDAESDLVAAVENVRERQPFFTGELAASMMENFVNAAAKGSGTNGGSGSRLTPRETEVVRLLAAGKSNKEAAVALSLSTRTVESHRTHIMKKMKFASFSDLVRYAVRNNLVEP